MFHRNRPQGTKKPSVILQRIRHFWRSRFQNRRWLKILGQVTLVGIALGAIAVVAVVAWASKSIPDPNNLQFRKVAQSTRIYAKDGSTLLYEIHGDQKRTVVDLKDISPDVIHAVISIEDKDFYNHSGFSIRGFFRSVWIDITRGSLSQGGSTLTQQLVKNAILTREKTISRKIKEVILSYQIERLYDKDQILKLYFNEIPWGSTAYGVEAAAQTYFGVRAKDLTLAESATLAAMVQRTSYYSPRGSHTEQLIDRQRIVLANMVAQGYITEEQAAVAIKEDVLKKVPAFQDKITAPHFVFYVRDQLVQKYGELTVEQGGLSVTTTLDPKIQKISEEEVAAGAKKNDKRGAGNAASVSVDPKTGQILAMVGSRDFFDTKKDGNFNVITSIRNPGSSFKPIVYLSAFTKGYSPDTLLFDLKTNFGPDGSGKNFIPNNYDFNEHGPLKMRQTLNGSLNIPAVKTLYLAGIPTTLDVSSKLGYSTFEGKTFGLALAIGGGGVEPLEHAAAFAALANDGKRNPVTGILKVVDGTGKILEQFKKDETQVVDKNAVRLLNDTLSDNNARAYVFGTRNSLTLGGRQVAAKTGTTNDFKDGWTVGYTPQLATVVWVGNNNNSPMKSGSDGSIVAAPIWNAIMRRSLDKQPTERFQRPSAVEQSKPVLQGKLPEAKRVAVDNITNKRIPDSCLSAWPSQNISYVTVNEVHDILYYLQKEKPNGPPLENPASDPMFSRWEAPVQAWAKKNKYVSTMPADEDCSLRVNPAGAGVVFTSPSAGTTISASTFEATISWSNVTEPLTATYTLDGVTSTTSSTAPYTGTISLAGVENGVHSLGVTITDAAGITASAALSITTSAQSGTTMYFIDPEVNAKITTGAFPYPLRFYVQDSRGISSITPQMISPSGVTTPLTIITNPTETTFTVSWPPVPAGKYRLYLVVVPKGGAAIESDRLVVTVE